VKVSLKRIELSPSPLYIDARSATAQFTEVAVVYCLMPLPTPHWNELPPEACASSFSVSSTSRFLLVLASLSGFEPAAGFFDDLVVFFSVMSVSSGHFGARDWTCVRCRRAAAAVLTFSLG
jgi:hypothetical protein